MPLYGSSLATRSDLAAFTIGGTGHGNPIRPVRFPPSEIVISWLTQNIRAATGPSVGQKYQPANKLRRRTCGGPALALVEGMRSERGYTLIEVLITLGLIGIVTAISVPVFMESNARSKLWTGSERDRRCDPPGPAQGHQQQHHLSSRLQLPCCE